jgi:hypothetical protein
VDPKNFSSGERAYWIIEKEQQYIKRLLRLIGFKKAFKVLAFHKRKPSRPDGNEWPHWHVVVDMADVGRIDLRRIWSLWRDKWKVGGLDLQVNRKCRNATQAVNYAISYCQHQSGVVAEWVKDSERAPRAYEVYGQLRTAVKNHEKQETEQAEADNLPESIEEEAFETSVKRDITYVGDRLNHCDDGSVVLLKTTYGHEAHYEYVSNLPYSEGQIALAGKLMYVDVKRQIIKDDYGARLHLYLPIESRDDPQKVVETLLRGLNQLPIETIPI